MGADVADRAAKVLATRPETDAAELRKAEDAMCERDEGVRLVAEQRNALETCVLELRAAKNGSHYKLFEDKAVEFGELLQAAEDWLWSDEASNADAIAKKKEQVLADAKLLVPEYFAKVEAERLATEKGLEKEAATATNEEDEDDQGGLTCEHGPVLDEAPKQRPGPEIRRRGVGPGTGPPEGPLPKSRVV